MGRSRRDYARGKRGKRTNYASVGTVPVQVRRLRASKGADPLKGRPDNARFDFDSKSCIVLLNPSRGRGLLTPLKAGRWLKGVAIGRGRDFTPPLGS